MSDEKAEKQLTPANQNMWYLLMTWYGEPTHFEDPVTYQNRLFWHRYMGDSLSSDQIDTLADLCQKNLENIRQSNPEERQQAEEEYRQYENFIPFTRNEKGHHILELRDRLAANGAKDFGQLRYIEMHIELIGVEFRNLVDFNHYIFPRYASFSNSEFHTSVSFRKACFLKKTGFSEVICHGNIGFQEATFKEEPLFFEATFKDNVEFSGAKFLKNVSFRDASFFGGGHFEKIVFSGTADFSRKVDDEDVKFSKGGFFNDAIFMERANFRNVIFSKWAEFSRVKFHKQTFFQAVTFQGEVKFCDSVFKSTTDFTKAVFAKAPEFHGCEIYVDTIWPESNPNDEVWPTEYASEEEAKVAERAWATLKLLMNKVMRHEHELTFFALELQARAEHKGKTLSYRLYESLSDFGQGVSRPAFILLMMSFAFLVLYMGIFIFTTGTTQESWETTYWGKAILTSFVSSFPFVGLQKYIYGGVSGCIVVLSGVQTILSTILLFLIGLGIRNKYRIK
ncbi:MAG: pentapeptide repeat-containing protein [Emcibacter sp.]|nr:pentapeptide repeat-containing protein [Emcibacter sp.]